MVSVTEIATPSNICMNSEERLFIYVLLNFTNTACNLTSFNSVSTIEDYICYLVIIYK